MSKTQLQTNNAKLSALITELQGKAAGGGGGSPETCTVIIGGGGMLLSGILGYAYTTLDDNGQIVSKTSTLTSINTPHEITCLVNSVFWIKDNGGGGPGFPDMLQFTGCELVKHFDKDASLLMKLTCGAGETASIR